MGFEPSKSLSQDDIKAKNARRNWHKLLDKVTDKTSTSRAHGQDGVDSKKRIESVDHIPVRVAACWLADITG